MGTKLPTKSETQESDAQKLGNKILLPIKFDRSRCVTNMSNEDIKCAASKRRPGYEISYDWAISLMCYLMKEVNLK